MVDYLKDLDTRLFLILNGLHNSSLDFFFYWVSDKWIWIPFYVFMAIVVWKNERKKILPILVFIALAITIADQVASTVIKQHVMRFRPCHEPELAGVVHLVRDYCGGNYGFVSSHAANVFALAIFLHKLLKAKWPLLCRIVWIWALTVSYSRIYLGVHYPGDILGGIAVGLFAGWISFYVFQKLITTLTPLINSNSKQV